MKMNKSSLLCIAVLSFSGLMVAQNSSHPDATLSLRDGWSLQSSCKVDAKGETLSTPAFHPKDWYEVSVPTTVVAALVKHKVYPDPFFGTNLRTFPGVTYPIGANFSNIPMQPDSPFIVPWWYRKEFVLPASFKGKTIWLNFGGINYRANIFLNGKQLAKSEDVAGAWRTYEFNITDAALIGKPNVLAVQVFSPTDTDLAITFVDWNPAPPDKNMGLFRDVDITTSGPVALRYPAVVSKVDSPANDKAHLTVTALLKNAANHPVKGTLKGQIEKIEFSQEVELGAGESKDVAFTSEQFPQLNIDHPRLWWPAQMGKPERYSLSLEFNLDGKDFRPGGRKVWHSRGQIRSARSQPAPVFHQWQERPDPRRRLVSRHDAARGPAAPARPFPLCAGHGIEHHPPRRQAGNQRVLRSGRRARNSAHRRLVLLRSLGALGELEGAGFHHRGTIVARPDVPPARPSQPDRVAERQRQPAPARR